VLLRDGSIPADPILRDGEILGPEEHLTVCYELHHVLLPELSDEGLVEFNRFEDKVRQGTRFDDVRRLLGQIGDDHNEYLDSTSDQDLQRYLNET
jgi:hypothetical protein